MIIEKITAFTTVKIAWEILEILHFMHVGHIASKASYKGGSSVKHAMQHCYQEWQDKKDPTQRRMRKAETPYDFKAISDTTQAINDINTQVETYLAKLNSSVENLQKAKDCFSDIHDILTKLVNALKSNSDDQFSNLLLQLKSKFISFKDEFDKFSFSIKPPPRQLLYVADLDGNKMGVINQYNNRLQTMKDYFDLLEETEQKIANQFKKGFNAIPTLLPSTSSSSIYSPEQLQQAITQCIDSPKNTSETMLAIFQNDTELATTCADIVKLFASFQKIHKTMQTISLEDDPAWFCLLTDEKEIEEVGQRIFLHAMNEAKISDKDKLLIAKIFLRKPVPTHLMKQIEVDELAYEMADILRRWQIEKCEQLTQFLSTLTKEGVPLPSRKQDPDGRLEWELLEWLKTQREEQHSIDLFKTILVSPCCFSQCSIKSARTQLKDLSLAENIDILIQKHLNSHWGTIWEKSDNLIQLPLKFKTDILPTDRMKPDTSEKPNVVSSVIQELAVKLITDLEKLKVELVKSRSDYSKKLKEFNPEKEKAIAIQKDQGHENGVERIKQLQSSIQDIDSSLDSSLAHYLYQPKAINPNVKARQVPTIDDLCYVIYKGVDPNSICQWKTHYQNVPQNDKLIHYFTPDQQQQDETRTKAWLYACTICQVNAMPAFSHLFTTDRLLALENTPESQAAIKNSLSIQVFFKDPKKISSIATNSKALNGVTPKTVEETETAFQQLQDYYVLALVRVHPEYRNQLPFGEQLKCLVKNLFKVGQEIGKNRLEHVQVYMGDLCAVLSGEHVEAINTAITKLNENYNSLCATAKRAHKSQLYAIMDKAIKGPIAEIKRQMGGLSKEMPKTPSDLNSMVKQVEEKKDTFKELENERKEKEAAQAREQEERKEKEKEREEKEKEREEKETERKEKEAAQAREKEERKEKEAAQVREQEAQAEIERLKALYAELKKQVPPQPIATGSRATLFPAPQATNTMPENPVLPENSYAP
ncbi:hypothetical protein [Rickettsiella endosymbiont of Dermanyssus gallinae]|uniref:hypothetical protein n=1 Tax=Rickettsiella endosymbiont of Dermanyssus gallinae TaxID=2856608 RepID=UPI001C52C132|nr:hypothetical protein [Rickettsiella endosymbiont of Dermanyssus gallinae]